MSGFRGRVNNSPREYLNVQKPYSLTRTVKPVIRVISQPPRDFGRGLIIGKPKVREVGGVPRITITDITASFRAGVQTRNATVYLTKAVFKDGPQRFVKLNVAAAKVFAREALVVPNIAAKSYRTFRNGRMDFDKTSVVERGLDSLTRTYFRKQVQWGVKPYFDGPIGFVVRGAIIGTIFKGTSYVSDKLEAVERTVQQASANYQELSKRFKFLRPTYQPADVGADNGVVRPPVVPLAPVEPPVRPNVPNPSYVPPNQNRPPVFTRPTYAPPAGRR